MASPSFPEPPAVVPPTPIDRVDAYLDRLAACKNTWVRMGIAERIDLLERCINGTLRVAPEWAAASCRAKGIDPNGTLSGEAWLSGPMTTIRNMRLLIESLKESGQRRPPALWKRPNGQTVARVFPTDMFDRLLFTGFTAELWIEPGKSPSQGAIYRDKSNGLTPEGAVGLVLSAGNVSSIGPMDMLHKLFVEDEVVILKTNPVNAYVGPYLERAFSPLIEQGFFAVVHGGADVGSHLCHHELVDSVHITGSDRTHDTIVWGGDSKEQAGRKKKNDPILRKPITSELGCVTPILVVPGPWSDADLDFQARHVAGMVAHNGSFNCNAGKVLITAKGWPLREEFLHRVQDALTRTPTRKAYYPGAQARYEAFLNEYPEAIQLATKTEDVVPWTWIPNVQPNKGEYALTHEAFCAVIAEVALDAKDAPDFLASASKFANECVWGTLSCSLLVHPETEKAYPEAVDKAIGDLRYGGIGINVWPGVIYGLVVTSWGAFPGHPLDEIVSGRGSVHNSYMFDHPQKSVVQAPFRIRPTPVWFPDNRALNLVGKRLTEFEASPSLLKFPHVAAAAIRG